MTDLLSLRNVDKSFGGVHALRGVSFDLQAGEVHALIGENGAGKSTLIKIITGATQPDSGTLEIAGQPFEDNNPERSRQLGIAAIYQQPALFPDLSVAENIALGLESPIPWRMIRWGERRRRAKELLQRVNATIDVETLACDLSMPEQQLVEIAKALGADARILIMDEPTASLSDREVEKLFAVIRELKGQGVGIIYVSHRLDELFQIADRVTTLRDGVVVGSSRMAGTSRNELIRGMVGRDVQAVFPKRVVPIGETMFQACRLSCAESGIADVDLIVRAGEIVGLAGLVGSGRTELARILFGLTPADSGEIRVAGNRVAIASPADAVGLGIAYVPEDRRKFGVILDLPIAANITLATLRTVAHGNWLDFAKEAAVANQFVERLGIKTDSVESPVGNLSGGNQQKVVLARWMATEPRIIILDEPTQGVDVGAKAEIHRLMGDLVEHGVGILMISSELPEVLGMSDRIYVMHAGRIAGLLERSEATPERIMELAIGHPARASA